MCMVVNSHDLLTVPVYKKNRIASLLCIFETTTVHSRYLGSKKPLGGLYHCINIGSFFLMRLDKYGIKLYIRDVFFCQSVWCRGYLGELSNIFNFIFCRYGVRVLWNPIFFIRFVTHISISLMIFMLNYAFAYILFLLRKLLLAVEMSDWQAFRSQARQIAATDPI